MNDVLKELSWPLKLKVLNELPGILDKGKHPPSEPVDDGNHRKDPTPIPALPQPHGKAPRPGIPVYPGSTHEKPAQAKVVTPGVPKITEGVSTSPGGVEAGHEEFTTIVEPPAFDVSMEESLQRRVGVELLTARRDAGQDAADDNDMRLKLFRLMYETVRDSDLKVKRAELIKEHYVNSTTFEIGYLVGDVTDKASIISDISMTLKRFYSEWKPIEQINAYEQIANQAIEITHLIELVRIVNKKDKDSGNAGRSYHW